MDDEDRRQALADFLRTRRARLAPEDVGLPGGQRRRTPGLRREEVAQLAHIGISWYTALEQGRDIQPSEPVLNSLATALRLDRAERQHLYTLARLPLPAEQSGPSEQASVALERMLEALMPHPAYVLGRRWDLLASNEAADFVFGFDDMPEPYPRNLLWRSFLSPRLQEAAGRERVASGMVAQFRADYARCPGDPWFDELIGDLRRASPDFARCWAQHDVLELPDCHKKIPHPTLGELEFDYASLQVPAEPGLKLIVFTAVPATVRKLEEALQSV